MEQNPYNRSIHYSTSQENDVSKDYYSLKSLSKEVFPELSEDRAYRNTLDNFKEACSLLGKDVEEYRTGENTPFRIPANQKTAIILLIRNVTIYKSGLPFKDQDYKKITEYAKDLIRTNDAIDEADFSMIDANIDDYANFQEIYYNSSDIRFVIAHQLKMEVIEQLMEDFKYIAEKVPEDRTTMYTEFYRNEVQRTVKKYPV
ncbi:hypothetical protein [Paenibacillus chitinolyticus]